MPFAKSSDRDSADRESPFRDDFLWLLFTGLALVALLVAVSGGPSWLAALCAMPAWGAQAASISSRIVSGRLGAHVRASQAGRILLAVLPGVIYIASAHRSVLGAFTFAMVGLLPICEPLLSRILSYQQLGCAHLPGVKAANRRTIPMTYVMAINHLAIGVAIAVTGTSAPLIAAFSAISVAVIILLVSFADAYTRYLWSEKVHQNIAQSVTDYEPQFIVYYTAPVGSEYQIRMWLPYLERIGKRFIVVLRNSAVFSEVSSMTTAPVVVRPRLRDLDDVTPPCVKAAFYVNNGATNSHFIRYADITHVQLLHGDSDKPASFNPVTAMFDQIFVAGQAAIDRYEQHGVSIPEDKFTIVGRPQVESVRLRNEDNMPVRRVLYAPTWEGYQSETNYTSLHQGPAIVEALIKRGIEVTFRPHPFSYLNPGYAPYIHEIHALLSQDTSSLNHLWGKDAEKKFTLFDCFNNCDALISDVSSVIPDFLFSTKPFAIVSAQNENLDDFELEFPIAEAGYVLRPDVGNLTAVLDDLLVTDRRADRRTSIREHYLGPFPPDAYADGFLRACKRVLAPVHTDVPDRSILFDAEVSPEPVN